MAGAFVCFSLAHAGPDGVGLLDLYFTAGISLFSVRAKTHRKMRIPSEKYFSNGVPSEKYPRKYNDRKIQLFCVFAVRNNFSVGVTRTKKIVLAQIKFKCCVR